MLPRTGLANLPSLETILDRGIKARSTAKDCCKWLNRERQLLSCQGDKCPAGRRAEPAARKQIVQDLVPTEGNGPNIVVSASACGSCSATHRPSRRRLELLGRYNVWWLCGLLVAWLDRSRDTRTEDSELRSRSVRGRQCPCRCVSGFVIGALQRLVALWLAGGLAGSLQRHKNRGLRVKESIRQRQTMPV
jgi:hypothetical protein